MAIPKKGNSGGAQPAPKSAPKNESKNEPKKPAENRAAKDAPKETRTAARNSFGDVPNDKNAKGGDDAKNNNPKNTDAPKKDTPAEAPKDASSAQEPNPPTGDQNTPVGDPKVPAKDPNAAAKEPNAAAKDPSAAAKDPSAAAKDPSAAAKDPSAAAKDPSAAAKDPSAAPKDPNTPAKDPNAAPGTPAATNTDSPQPKTNLTPPDGSPNGNLPPPAPPTDPKAGTPETPLVDPEVDKALNTPGANGKTATEEASAKTMEDLQKYANGLKEKGLPNDAVAKYYKLKQAEAMVKLGIPTGADPKDPTVPAVPGTPGEASTSDIFDAKKIEDGIKNAEADPAVQSWLAGQQAKNQEAILEEKIKNGEIPDIPKDPVTGQRTDYLKNKQAEYLKNPEVVKAIATLPGDKMAEAIGKANAPFGILGATAKESKEQLYNLIDKVTDITGAPKPFVNDNFDPVKTPDGDNVIKDPSTGKGIAIDKTGKVVTDPNTDLPAAIGKDGNQLVDPYNRPVVITKSGYTAVQDKDGTMLVVGTDKNGNENIPMTNPDNTLNKIIIDKQTDLPVELDAKTGLPLTDAQTGLPKVVDVTTGKTVTNPATGNAIVADKETGAPVEVDFTTGKIVTDAEGNPVVADPTTGYQVWDKNGNAVVVDKLTKLPLIVDPKTGIKTIANPKTGTPLLDPTKGTTAIIDPASKLPIAAITNKETGEFIKNSNGQIAQFDEGTGLPVLIDPKTGDKSIVDPATGLVVLDPKGNSLYVDKATGLPVAKTPGGFDVTETMSGAKVIYDPKTGIPIGSKEAGTLLAIDPVTNLPVEVDYATRGAYTKDANGNTVVMDPATGKQKTTTDGKAIVIDKKANTAVTTVDGKNLVVNPYTGEYVTDKDAGVKVMIDPNSGSPVYQDPTSGEPFKDPFTGGLQIVDPKTGAALKDVDGSAIQIDPKTGAPAVWDAANNTFKATAPLPVPVTGADGNPVKNADGNIVAKDGATGNTILLDPATNRPIDGPKAGMSQLVDQNGNLLKDAGGNALVQDKESGWPVAVDAKGNMIVDPKGNALVYNQQGKQVADANGNPVVLDKDSGATFLTNKVTGEPLMDKAGNVYIANAKTGGIVTDPETGNVAVLDKESKAPVLAGADGTVYKDAKGNAYLADVETGKAKTDGVGNYIVVDKNVGVPVVVDPKTGVKTMVGNDGEPLKDPKTGATFEVGKNGLPQLVLDNGNGEKIVIDPQTGKQMEIDGNKVYIDPKTGLTVMSHPVYGTIDIISGKAPVAGIDGEPPNYGEKAYDIWKAIRAGIGSIYRTTYGIFGGSFSKFKNDAFFQNTKNFHASRMVSAATGIATAVMTALRWAPGTEMHEKLKNGDLAAVTEFTEDMASNVKYLGFYPKTTQAFLKYFFGDPAVGKSGVKLALDNKTIYKVSAGGGASVYVAKGGINPFTGVASETGGWVQAPTGSFNPVDGVVNPLNAPPEGAPLTGPEPTPTVYAKVAASKLFGIIKTSASVAMGLGNILGGAMQGYRGGVMIHDAIKEGNAALGVAGGFNVFAGATYVVSGVSSIVSALGMVGAIASTIAGVGMALGNVASLIALVVELASDPNGMKHPGEVWANKVTDEFKDVDVFKADANKTLADWYKQYATDYWARKKAEDSLYEPKYEA